MSEQEHEFQSAYGEAMFYAHLIEDLLELHLYECSYFMVNGYSGLSRKKIRDMKHEKRIDQLLIIYGEQDKNNGSIKRLVMALHHLRKIRNYLTHAFIPQTGSDFGAQEGIDQIIAMLKKVSYWERGYFKTLQDAHDGVLNGAIKNCLDAVIEREASPFDARVSQSKIQEHLDALRNQLKG